MCSRPLREWSPGPFCSRSARFASPEKWAAFLRSSMVPQESGAAAGACGTGMTNLEGGGTGRGGASTSAPWHSQPSGGGARQRPGEPGGNPQGVWGGAGEPAGVPEPTVLGLVSTSCAADLSPICSTDPSPGRRDRHAATSGGSSRRLAHHRRGPATAPSGVSSRRGGSRSSGVPRASRARQAGPRRRNPSGTRGWPRGTCCEADGMLAYRGGRGTSGGETWVE